MPIWGDFPWSFGCEKGSLLGPRPLSGARYRLCQVYSFRSQCQDISDISGIQCYRRPRTRGSHGPRKRGRRLTARILLESRAAVILPPHLDSQRKRQVCPSGLSGSGQCDCLINISSLHASESMLVCTIPSPDCPIRTDGVRSTALSHV